MAPIFNLKWSADFSVDVPLGSWGSCTGNLGGQADAPPLGSVQGFWAYPYPWQDTASENDYAVGGCYDPATTAWVSGGQLHIKMYRDKSSPSTSVHSCAMVPMAATGIKYGRFMETWRISESAKGYKSAHLLWPVSNNGLSETDFPEGDWDSTVFCAYHNMDGKTQEWTNTGHYFSDEWTTTRLDWTPSGTVFYINELEVFKVSGGPYQPMNWILQNETALDGEVPAVGSSAQMDISAVSVYSYTGPGL